MKYALIIFILLISGCTTTRTIIRTQLCMADGEQYDIHCIPAALDPDAFKNLNGKTPIGILFADGGAYITVLDGK